MVRGLPFVNLESGAAKEKQFVQIQRTGHAMPEAEAVARSTAPRFHCFLYFLQFHISLGLWLCILQSKLLSHYSYNNIDYPYVNLGEKNEVPFVSPLLLVNLVCQLFS